MQDYRNIPGNIKTSAQVNSTHARDILPGNDADGISKVPGYIPGQRLSTGLSVGLADYKTTTVSGLSGKERSNLPFTDYSSIHGQSVSAGLSTRLSTGVPDHKTTIASGLHGKEESNVPLRDYSLPSRQTHPSTVSTSLADYKSRPSPPEKDYGPGHASEGVPGFSRSIPGTTTLSSARNLLEQNQAVSGPSGLYTPGQSTSATATTFSGNRIPGSTLLSDQTRAVTSVVGSGPVSYSTTQSGLAGSCRLRDMGATRMPGTSSLRDQYLSRVLPLTTSE